LGAAGIRFGHLLPTSKLIERKLSISDPERQAAEAEVRRLDSTREISVSFAASARNTTPGACCEPLAGKTITVDCYGRLSLCCQLAGYRGAADQRDIVADLHTTDFGNAYAGFLARAVVQRRRRDSALARGLNQAEYPCDFCAGTMGKTEWRDPLKLGADLGAARGRV
jgi:hypothetical protein